MLYVLACLIPVRPSLALKAVHTIVPAAFQMLHLRRILGHVLIPTHVMVSILAVPGGRRLVQAHVRVVPAMPEHPPATVAVVHVL